MPASPLDPARVADIQRLAAEGVSRAQIALRVGCGERTVSKYAAPGSFDRSATAAAVAARRVDMAARRARLADDLLSDAERLRAQLWEPHTVFAFGGKDNEYNEREHPEPTPADKRNLLQAAATALTQSIKLSEYDSAQSPEAAKSMLSKLADALEAAAPALRGDAEPE